MNDDHLIPIYQTNDLGRAEVIKAALEGEGIACSIDNEHQAGLTGVLQCRLFVMQKDQAAALQFIEQHEPHLTDPDDDTNS